MHIARYLCYSHKKNKFTKLIKLWNFVEFLMPVHYVVLRTWSHKQSLFNPWCGSQEDLRSFPLLVRSLALWSWCYGHEREPNWWSHETLRALDGLSTSTCTCSTENLSHKQSFSNSWCGFQEDLRSFTPLVWSLPFWFWLDMVTDLLCSNNMDPKKMTLRRIYPGPKW